MSKLRIYTASAMTGRTGEELVKQAEMTTYLGTFYGVTVLDPIKAEKVEPTKTPLNNGGDKLKDYWKRDKEMIRAAHVLIDLTGSAKSEGVSHEIGYARFFLFKPIIRVYPGLGASIARLEDDLIASSVNEAFQLAVENWGTPFKRLNWRVKLYNRCLVGMVKTFIHEWINIF